MKKSLITFLQIIVAIIGLAAFTFMLWEPPHEGVNAHATFTQIYFQDPFLLYAYTASIAFFIALYQIIKLLTFIRNNRFYSPQAVKALRIIKSCALALIVFIIGAGIHAFIYVRGKDDIAGAAMLGFIMILISAVVAITANVSQKIIQNASNSKTQTA